MTSQDRVRWLQSLKRGDRVLIHSQYMKRWHVRRVSKATIAKVFIGNVEYDRYTGMSCSNAARDRVFPASLEIPTGENLRKAEILILRNLVRNVDWDDVTVTSLRVIAAELQLPYLPDEFEPEESDCGSVESK